MNAQNWNLNADQLDSYIPQKLPFFASTNEPQKLINLQPTHTENQIKLSDATLVLLPGTLPFADLTPHDGKSLHTLFQNASSRPIGKLRVHKSGRVTMRFQVEGRFIDFEVNKGIESKFYQEAVSVDPVSKQIHILAPVERKIIVTPNVESLF